jgi:ssDNA-binding Zn-finger/Zn-ribbon topoisomerase 1
MGYELTPTDLQEMLHGEKVTSSEKTLTWNKDGKETTIRGRLLLNEEYKVRIAPKLKSKQITDEACPKCKSGKLQLITAIDDSKWYGCNGYPQCRFTKPFIPHTFKNDRGGAKAGKKGTGVGARNCDSGGGQSQSTTLRTKETLLREKPSSGAEKPNTLANTDSDSVALAGAAINERPNISTQATAMPAVMTPDASDGIISEAIESDRYQRIPKFILRMLKLDREPSVKSLDAPSLS